MSRKVMFTLITRVMNYPDITIFEDSTDFAECLVAVRPVPTVIFLDVQIGPLDGYQMLEVIRNTPEYADTTVIAMTANVMSHDVEQLRSAGFNGLIGKPIMKQHFPQLLERILEGEQVWFVP